MEKYLLASMKLPISDDLAEQREERSQQAQKVVTPAPKKDEEIDEDDEELEDELDDDEETEEKQVKAMGLSKNIMAFNEEARTLLDEIDKAIAHKRKHATES